MFDNLSRDPPIAEDPQAQPEEIPDFWKEPDSKIDPQESPSEGFKAQPDFSKVLPVAPEWIQLAPVGLRSWEFLIAELLKIGRPIHPRVQAQIGEALGWLYWLKTVEDGEPTVTG
jgi:hypothetical protein